MQLCKQRIFDHPCGDSVSGTHLSNGDAFCVSGGCFSNDTPEVKSSTAVALTIIFLIRDFMGFSFVVFLILTHETDDPD